jgi:hypothetical protein
MNYFVFPLQLITIFVSLKFPMVLTFKGEKIIDRVGPYQTDMRITDPSRVKNSLIVETLKPGITNNMVVFTDKSRFTINFVHNEELAVSEVEVSQAREDGGFIVEQSNDKYELLRGKTSMLFINKLKHKVLVNDQIVSDKKFLSLGPPIVYENDGHKELLYYKR